MFFNPRANKICDENSGNCTAGFDLEDFDHHSKCAECKKRYFDLHLLATHCRHIHDITDESTNNSETDKTDTSAMQWC